MTNDFQAVTVQGQLTYRIVDYRRTTQILNYTYDLKERRYISDDPSKLAQRVINIAKVLTKSIWSVSRSKKLFSPVNVWPKI